MSETAFDRLDDVVHQRTRLGVLTILAEVDSAAFTYLRDELGLSDGNLSRHLRVLEEAGTGGSSLEDVGVVVIARNEGERLGACLASLPDGVTVVYVDSDSSDGSLELELLGQLQDLASGEYVYVRVQQTDGGMAWSSPVFIQ